MSASSVPMLSPAVLSVWRRSAHRRGDEGGRSIGRLVLLGLVVFLGGCSEMTNARLGIRPDARPFNPGADPCAQLKDMVDYSQVLQEAYHTRATQNRFWIYGAGTVALGTVAATGGL